MTQAPSDRDATRIVIVGHVDHGKSTLVGRLLHDTGALPTGKAEAVRLVCERRGKPMEWAFVLDAFQAERDQGITIDKSHIAFASAARRYHLIDAPGHREFLKNMVSGAATADAAVLIVDAVEGLRPQTRSHAYLLSMLGIDQLVVAVTKMDLVDHSADRFAVLNAEIAAYLKQLGLRPTHTIPTSAHSGENLAGDGDSNRAMTWYGGPTLLAALDSFDVRAPSIDRPLRFPIQDVYKFDERRIYAGRIEAGTLRIGDTLLFSPSGKTATVHSIEAWSVPDPQTTAATGQSTGIVLNEQIFVERGEMASHVAEPPILTTVFRANLFWFAETPLRASMDLRMRINTAQHRVDVQAVEAVIDTDTLVALPADAIGRNQIGTVILRSRTMVALDESKHCLETGRFVLFDGHRIAGGGLVSMQGYPDQRKLMTAPSRNLFAVSSRVTADMRRQRNGHRGGVLWFTGLSGSGKSTLAIALEHALFLRGHQVYVLDGDNIRAGLNANLGFSPEDRAENIRRIGEVAALFADAGFIVITAFISPYRADRERARAAAGEAFREVYIRADIAICESRDPKGLYRRARAGEIAEFTGISAPYELPEAPDLIIEAGDTGIEACVGNLVAFVERSFVVTQS